MSRALEIIYESTITTILRTSVKSFPHYYKKYSANPENTKCNLLLSQYEDIISTSLPNILRAISADINVYLNYYNVMPKGSIDEFKAIYFTGRAMSRYFTRMGYSDLRRINDHTTIELLDYRLQHKLGMCRDAMSNALHKVVDDNSIEEQLGKHGLYLLYKCTYNALCENQKENL